MAKRTYQPKNEEEWESMALCLVWQQRTAEMFLNEEFLEADIN